MTKFDVFHFGTFFFFVMLKLQVDGFDNSWFSSKEDIIGICRPIQIQFNIVSPDMTYNVFGGTLNPTLLLQICIDFDV